MIRTLIQIPQYRLFHRIGFPRKLPLNVTVSVTYNCNSRCLTCYVWKRKAKDLTLEELDRVFQSLGKAPYWFTISGGEPFLRRDIVEICQSIYRHCHPGVINIPTNGLLFSLIPDKARQIIEFCPQTNVVINLSLDAIGSNHDRIRNVPGNWEKALKTYEGLRALHYPNFQLGIHSVISVHNVQTFPNIYDYLMKELKPDSYVTEIAEERVELDTVGTGITPSLEEYSKAIDFLSSRLRQERFNGFSRITQAFRLQYYGMVKRTLAEKRQVIPCYAGFASAHIAPDGDVWACCIKAEPIGNLREVNYDFRKIWFSPKANELRQRIKDKECYCPLANASYTNMLCHIPTLWRAGWRVIRK